VHPDKADCLVLDFDGNILRHGPIDAIQIKEKSTGAGIAPAKECAECRAAVHAAYATCRDCGCEFPSQGREKHDVQASGAGILSGQVTGRHGRQPNTSYRSKHIGPLSLFAGTLSRKQAFTPL